jgi:hypothetical protein
MIVWNYVNENEIRKLWAKRGCTCTNAEMQRMEREHNHPCYCMSKVIPLQTKRYGGNVEDIENAREIKKTLHASRRILIFVINHN